MAHGNMFGDLAETNAKQGFFQRIVALKKRLFEPSRCLPEIELDSKFTAPSLASNAVVVKGAFMNYGSLKVLEDFNMTVPKGAIYGLLGASGCGKTTLLECLNGRKGLSYGTISVLGQEMPGPRNETKIGYMPQATSLYADLTVGETLLFFGRLIGMKEGKIEERSKYLIELLMIPDPNQRLSDMSGGQQRRLSLAVALQHEPELLILDEPTVGMDSVLRQLIWDHFRSLTASGEVTIIITTHYIEETLTANLVGLMRGGCLMAEDDPKNLLKLHQLPRLEDVLLKFCVAQNQSQIAKSANSPRSAGKIKEGMTVKHHHLKALVLKNFQWLRKNWITTMIALLLPVVILSSFGLTFGHNPTDFVISVVNLEVEPKSCRLEPIHCKSEQLSCTFLNYLSNKQLLMTFYSSEFEAIQSVRSGRSYASIAINVNFSRALRSRAYDWFGSNSYDLEHSTISVFRDTTVKPMSLYLQRMLYQILQDFVNNFVESCGINKNVVKVPMTWDAIYEWMNTDFNDFAMPGVLTLSIFASAIIGTSLSMHSEQSETIMERLLVTGVNRTELILSYVMTNSVVLFFQTFFSMVIVFAVFDTTMKGSLILAAILTFLGGFAGVCYGMLISCITHSEVGVCLIGIGTTFTVFFASGTLWPVEAMHRLLKPLAPFFPLTMQTRSIRNILHKDWNFLRADVYVGFFTIVLWAALPLALCFILIRFKRV
ncbi:ABC transporter G family member 23-like isoform X1 [Photinus pyralis]|uniref:ABC transporter G family member 23-like isoform X1 n=1 Tax=Photinus pyralis TaxID=7054 RepID=UPI0012671E65|nr:ABC transporter G family member 23-like isoform X1 [Photinus pyralis]